MATGYYDANGIWQYGEDDNIALFSGLLNLGMDSTSDAFTADRARIAFLEQSVEQASTFVASSAAARNSYWGVPANATEQLALQNKGARTVRTDLGITEQYFGVYNASTNVGGRDVAGWYPTNRTVGLIPLRPTSVQVSGGSASADSEGIVSYNAGTISLNGIWDTAYSRFRVVIAHGGGSNNTDMYFRLRTAGTDYTGTNYNYNAYLINMTNGTVGINRFGSNSTVSVITAFQNSAAAVSFDIVNPNNGAQKFWTGTSGGNYYGGVISGYMPYNTATDGLSISAALGTMSGAIQVFGYLG